MLGCDDVVWTSFVYEQDLDVTLGTCDAGGA